MNSRQEFSSKWGFVLAATGSAVGLGNIWGFPTQAANHGGSAFILVYLLVIVLLAIPALYCELVIGFRGKSNPVSSLEQACKRTPRLGKAAGFANLFAAIMMLSFYSIIAGWMFAHGLGSLCKIFGLSELSHWLTQQSSIRSWIFTLLVVGLSATIIVNGVKQGIEKWSKRLMPLLFFLLIVLIIYFVQLPGAEEGISHYLTPDFSKIGNAELVIAAMGQAFFSLSIGVGGMMIYGSYLSPKQNLAKLTFSVAALDSCVALLAGLLIIPALYVAQEAGAIISEGNDLVGRSQLIFKVLPYLFEHLGWLGNLIGFSFFGLLSVASLTSAIGSTEVPVSYLTETPKLSRKKATIVVSLMVLTLSSCIIINFDWLFKLITTALTHYMLPLMGLFYFIVVGWLSYRSHFLPTQTTVQRLFSSYLRYVCPILMTLVFWHVATK